MSFQIIGVQIILAKSNFIKSLKALGFSAVSVFIVLEFSIKLKAFNAKCYVISSMNIRIQLMNVTDNVVSLPHFKYFFHKTRP